MTDEISRIKETYNTRYRSKPGDYANMWHARNPISYTFRHAQERAVIELFNRHNLRLEEATILDLGCGGGGWLRFLASLGASPENLYGNDLMDYRIEQARTLCPPAVHLSVEDAQNLPFSDHKFDLICQFTVFSSILDDSVHQNVVSQIMRLLKSGGYLLWYDMKNHFPPGSHIQGITANELRELFPQLSVLEIRYLHHRFISRFARRSWFLCELLERLPGMPHTNMLAILKKS